MVLFGKGVVWLLVGWFDLFGLLLFFWWNIVVRYLYREKKLEIFGKDYKVLNGEMVYRVILVMVKINSEKDGYFLEVNI